MSPLVVAFLIECAVALLLVACGGRANCPAPVAPSEAKSDGQQQRTTCEPRR